MNSYSELPKWVTPLKRFLVDTIIDYLPLDGSDDAITDKVTDGALAVVCAEYGHIVENDHCGIPDHRYCEVCGKSMSGVPLGHYTGPPVPRKNEGYR